MNRKLHNTILAFSVTGVMLFVGMVVAEPALPVDKGHARMAIPAASLHREDATQATPVSDGSARKDRPADPAPVTDTGEVIAMAAGLIALSVTEAALSAVLADLEPAVEDARTERDPPRKESPSRRKPRASRDLIAVPYFSFARGSRGSRS